LALNGSLDVLVVDGVTDGLTADLAFFAHVLNRLSGNRTVSVNPFAVSGANFGYVDGLVVDGVTHGLETAGAGYALGDFGREFLSYERVVARAVAAVVADFAGSSVSGGYVGSGSVFAGAAEAGASYETLVEARGAGVENDGAFAGNEVLSVSARKSGGVGAGESSRRTESESQNDYGFHLLTPNVLSLLLLGPLRDERVLESTMKFRKRKFFRKLFSNKKYLYICVFPIVCARRQQSTGRARLRRRAGAGRLLKCRKIRF
jgi:hypothetical protein